MSAPPAEPARPELAELAGAEIVRRGRGLALIAVVCVGGAAAVLGLSRPPLPTAPTLAALLAQGALALWLAATAYTVRSRAVRDAALIVTGLFTALPTWFFGPHGAFAAAVALVLVMAGLATEAPQIPRRTGWALYAALAASQLAIVGLVLADALPDRSLVPTLLRDHPAWHYVAAQAMLQGVYLTAFIAGRAAARRYRQLADRIADSARDAVRTDALLAEARADYVRAVEIARQGAVAPAGPRALGRPASAGAADDPSTATVEQASIATVDDGATPPPAAAEAELTTAELAADAAWIDPVAVSAWDDAYHAKMRYQDLAIVVLCVVGGALTAVVTSHPAARLAALAAIAGILLAFLARRAILRRDPAASAYGPWIAIAALGAGPAYGWGVHSGFAAVLATLLFAGGLFRATRATPARRLERVATVVAVMGTQAALFALIRAHVIPDAGNLPVFAPGAPAAEAYYQHLGLQATLLAAYVAGNVIDRRFADAFRRADAAHREVLRREAMLRETHAEIDAALRAVGGGLFTGTTIAGHAVGRLLGRGGMGEVYEATDPIGVRVALKLLRDDRAGDPASLARFLAEGEVLTRVESPFVARVLEVGGGAAGEVPFLAMSYVEGESLGALLRARTRLSLPGVRSLVRDVARGLHDVHDAGFVHLDVKPSNILLTEEVEMGTRWCLVDFGVARLAHDAAPSIAGTPQYMAPEQALGAAVDARADLFSLCLVVYRALTGRPAFAGTDPRALAVAARRGPPDPRRFAAMHDDVALALRIGLAYDPADRWASAFELRSAFERALAGMLLDEHRARARALLDRAPWA